MNLEYFIAKRIHFSKTNGKKKVSTPAIKIAIAGVAIGVATMILSVAIVIGFKREIRAKVVGFGAHIQIENYENNATFEKNPITVNDSLRATLLAINGIQHLEEYIVREGIIKTEDNFQGVIFKGVAEDYDWTFFDQNMVEGNILDTIEGENTAIISQYTANKLHLKLGDTFITYFLKENVQARKFTISGIYNTNFEDYDKLYVITHQSILQKLNKWSANQVSGIELLVNDFDDLDNIRDDVFFDMITYEDAAGNTLYARSIRDINPNIFNWLDLLDTNVWIIIILMFAVSGFTMVSGLLIIILERTNTIGILKALGHSNKNIRKTFLYISSFLVLKGMFWGNIFAILVIVLQRYFSFIKLDPETYYVAAVPVVFNLGYILLINISVLLISILMMVIPSYLIAKISPAKSIKYE